MKTLLRIALALLIAAAPVFAGPRVGVYVNWGGAACAPRAYAPPACYAPQVRYAPPVCYTPQVSYCSPGWVAYQPAVTFYQAPVYASYGVGTVVYGAPVVPVYRAPLVRSGVTVETVSFGWRR